MEAEVNKLRYLTNSQLSPVASVTSSQNPSAQKPTVSVYEKYLDNFHSSNKETNWNTHADTLDAKQQTP